MSSAASNVDGNPHQTVLKESVQIASFLMFSWLVAIVFFLIGMPEAISLILFCIVVLLTVIFIHKTRRYLDKSRVDQVYYTIGILGILLFFVADSTERSRSELELDLANYRAGAEEIYKEINNTDQEIAAIEGRLEGNEEALKSGQALLQNEAYLALDQDDESLVQQIGQRSGLREFYERVSDRADFCKATELARAHRLAEEMDLLGQNESSDIDNPILPGFSESPQQEAMECGVIQGIYQRAFAPSGSAQKLLSEIRSANDEYIISLLPGMTVGTVQLTKEDETLLVQISDLQRLKEAAIEIPKANTALTNRLKDRQSKRRIFENELTKLCNQVISTKGKISNAGYRPGSGVEADICTQEPEYFVGGVFYEQRIALIRWFRDSGWPYVVVSLLGMKLARRS